MLYLFLLAIEAFCCLLRRAREGGYLFGFKVNGKDSERMKVFHFLFVDDTLIFCGATQAQMTYLSWLVMWFEVVLSLKINLS